MIVRGLFAPISWAYLVLGELTGVPDGWGAVIMDARMLGQVDIIIVGMISIGIYVMTAAPGCILEEVALDLPRI